MITGEWLREARLKLGLTQDEVAYRTDFSTRQIGRFENDENLQKCNKYFALFRVLQLEDSKMKNTESEEDV